MSAKKKPDASVPMEEQDQSIKARKNQLFDNSNHDLEALKRPFSTYLKEVPGTPVSTEMKAAFWGIGVVVLILFLAAILGGRGRHPATPTRTSALATLIFNAA